jgi:hypothetical protein
MRSRTTLALLLGLFLASPTWSQLQTGDCILASTSGYSLIRTTGAVVSTTPIVPALGSGAAFNAGTNPAVPGSLSNFGNGSMALIPNTSFVLVGTGTTPFRIFLLDFTASTTNPLSYELGAVTLSAAAVASMTVDRSSGDVYFLQGTAIGRIPAPITPTTIVSSTPFATGQTGARALAVQNGQVVCASTTQAWTVLAGASAPGTVLVNFQPSSGCEDIEIDPVNNQLLNANFSQSRIDVYDLSSTPGPFVVSPLTGPQLSICPAVEIDESTNTVYALSFIGSTINGSPYGVQSGQDNVIVGVGSGGPSSGAFGVTPATGSGNAGNNPFFIRVKPYGQVVNGLQFNQGSALPTFNAGTMSATLTVSTIVGLPVINSAAQDALVSSQITVTAPYAGSDTAFLNGLALSGATINVFVNPNTPASGTPDATVTFGGGSVSTVVAGYAGASGTSAGLPTAVRRIGLTGPTVTIGNPNASPSLTNFMTRIMGGTAGVSLAFAANGTPNILSLDANASTGLPNFEARITTTAGMGDVQIGFINATPFADLFTLITPQIATPTGSGPFLGLAPDLNLFNQAAAPIGAQPFHVLANVNGQYSFALPPTPALIGVQIDWVAIEFIFQTSVQVQPAQTITF